MRARAALFRHVQTFFETQLLGLFRYGDVMFRPAEPAEKITGKRRYAYGREREIVHAHFGVYSLAILSPVEAPPLGRVEFGRCDGDQVESLVTGPIDPETFKRAASVIRADAITQRSE